MSGTDLSKQIAKVENVHWLDLGIPEATWVLRVNQLGPLIVSIDAAGNTLDQRVLGEARKRVEETFKEFKAAQIATAPVTSAAVM
jgi:tartrate dehydratase beta subunit/fumarate hydratase class I family protein